MFIGLARHAQGPKRPSAMTKPHLFSTPRGLLPSLLASLCALSLLSAPHEAWAQKKKKRKKDTSAATEPAPEAKDTKEAGNSKKTEAKKDTEKSAAEAQKPPPEPAIVIARRPKAAISRIADTLSRELEHAKPGSLIAAAPLITDTEAPKGAALAVSIAAQLAGRRGQGAWAMGQPVKLDEARTAARSEGGFIYLKIELTQGKLNVTADAYPISKSVWERAKNPEPGPIDHAFISVPIDAEVRSFLAPIPLSAVTATRAKNFESDVIALSCGDLGLDGNLEIVSVSRRRVSTIRIAAGKVIPLQSRPWGELSPVHPTPLREPIGFASIVPRAVYEAPDSEDQNRREWMENTLVDVALTDRARAVRLDSKLQVVSSFSQMAIPEGEGTACVRNWGLLLTGAVGPCSPIDPNPRLATVGGQYDAIASAELVSPEGVPFTVWAGREKGVLELRDSLGNRGVIDTSGAQVAVGDLDQDGEPEIISSVDTLNPMEDAAIVRTWQRAATGKEGKIKERFRMPAAAGIRALAACPADDIGRSPFVVATADEIWVVR